MDELVSKAANSPDTISLIEVRILLQGANLPNAEQLNRSRIALEDLPSDSRQLLTEARTILRSKDHADVQARARKTYDHLINVERSTAPSRPRAERLKAAHQRTLEAGKPYWVLRCETLPQCCFRTDYSDDVEWQKFRDELAELADGSFSGPRKVFQDKINKTWKIIYIEDEARFSKATVPQLNGEMHRLVSRGDIPPGIRKDYHLIFDSSTFKSFAIHHPNVPKSILVCDSEVDTTQKTKEGYQGSMMLVNSPW
ncbi:hypothetical protein K490DRAFT_58675 [Saccharata proteae CBS 121410]|uniref:Uncharacterized protein n=1 Tax=Saccharata proteae CBS 121410 TaxID=1314787 RepID=A0A9P4LTG5_9PEZI|nr:hypothetical protein K490DRAFT_58675 [Saccharata proteae CBS 121410]